MYNRGSYRALPSKRGYISKAGGGRRPLGIAVPEDKIVHRALVEVLNQVYEADFLGFSYGFRPGRSAHNALDALSVALTRRRVNWVLDADVRTFFNFPNVGKLLMLLFILLAAWFSGGTFSLAKYVTFLTSGLLSFFSGVDVACPLCSI